MVEARKDRCLCLLNYSINLERDEFGPDTIVIIHSRTQTDYRSDV